MDDTFASKQKNVNKISEFNPEIYPASKLR